MDRSTLCSLIRCAKRHLSGVIMMGALSISLNSALVPSASAAIYKCISGSGAVTYSGRKCPEEDTTARIIADSGIGSTGNRPAPAPAAANPTPGVQQQQQRAEVAPRTGELPPPLAN